jgi:gas vesicle protein
MRFIIGLLLGLGIGLAAALLMAPEKGKRSEGSATGEDAPEEEGFGDNHDSMAGLRRAMGKLQEQIQEAWGEARQAAQEAEQEMRARYERTVSKPER